MAETGTPPASGTKRRRFDWRAALITFLVLATFSIATSWPPLPPVLNLKIVFPEGRPGETEPIITTGEFSNGDLLVVKYQAPDRAVFSYDSWGAGGPTSAPITYRPGTEHTVQIEMPAFTELPGVSTRATAPLRIVFDGQEVIHSDVQFHRREPDQVYFAKNPIGGSAGAVFRGTLVTASGKVLNGGPATYFSTTGRVLKFFSRPMPLLGVVLLGLAAGFIVPLIWNFVAHIVAAPRRTYSSAPPHAWFIVTLVVAVIGFTYIVTDETWQLIYPESFGVFYDYQALSLMHGHLDVPGDSLSGEAFFYQGKCYGYFGPTPALMRIPFALLGVGLGKLSRGMMVFDYALCLIGAYMLLCHAVRLMGGRSAWPSRWATIVFTASVSLGSTLFFLSSRAYIYHEAIICGAAFGIWSAYFTLRYVDEPRGRSWIGALICGTLAVHARPPIGLFALVLLGVAAAVSLVLQVLSAERTRSDAACGRIGWKKPIAIGVLSILGVLSFNGLSYLKFRTIEGCPLRYNVQYSAERLARIDGKQFHLSNVAFGFDTYVRRPTVRITRHFPYFFTNGVDPAQYPEAKLDLVEPMAGLPYAMPALSLLALMSLLPWLKRTAAMWHAITAVWIAIIPPAVAMFAAIAVSHRYTTDFVPFLVTAAALGAAVIDSVSGILTRLIRWLLVGACALSIMITIALTIRNQGECVWGVPEETQQHYRAIRDRIDRYFGQQDT